MRDMPVFGGMFGDGGTTGSLPTGRTLSRPDYAKTYAGIEGERFPVAPFRFSSVDPRFLRQEVVYTGLEKPGTIVVDPRERHLYHVGEKNRATRYGVGVGREGFSWSGVAQINMKRDWPDWVPPSEMVARDPDIQAQLRDTSRGQGVPGGIDNPLGARAMYLFAEGGDTGYRIHGTTEPETIGQDVSSGCVRMVNQDVIHLYHRSPQGAKVVVLA
jgi:lipoprotein-anchoring transpeptidase ErfK/SrfK